MDRPTDDTIRSVAIGRIYVCGTAMWPNNYVIKIIIIIIIMSTIVIQLNRRPAVVVDPYPYLATV